jgi:hypothetical protein
VIGVVVEPVIVAALAVTGQAGPTQQVKDLP